MGNALPLLFVAVSAAEIFLFIEIGGAIGAGWTAVSVVATGILGGLLARHQGAAAFRELQGALATGRGVGSALVAGVLLLVGAILLITPGFLTDFLGFALLIPAVRVFLADRIRRRVSPHIVVHGTGRTQSPPPGVIDVE